MRQQRDKLFPAIPESTLVVQGVGDYSSMGLSWFLPLGFFAYEVTRALYVRSQMGSVFDTYVIQNHIGQADIADDSSAFQTVSTGVRAGELERLRVQATS